MTRVVKDILILSLVATVSTIALWIAVGMNTIYQNFDGPYYAVVARCFYNFECIGNNFSFPLPNEYYAAHLPIYPLLMRIFGGLKSAPLINLLVSIVSAIVLYKMSGEKLWIALAWLFFWPRMWVVRSVGSPETLFILFILLSLYFFQKNKYWLAGLAGAGAVLTKSPGVLLFLAFVLARPKIKIWPVLLIPLTLLGLFGVYKLQNNDFWAYFHSGDNIHLQILPFRIFDSNQSWVGTFWLEDVLWIYIVGAIGIIYAFKKNRIWGTFGAIYYATILFVSHRDIARYSLPIVPVVLMGFSDLLQKKEIRWVLAIAIIPMFFYSVNFLLHNQVAISDWGPFL